MGNEKKKFLNLTIREVLIAMKDWLIKNKVPAFVYFLIGMMIVLGIFSESFREHFLFDQNDKFQWIGVSAIVGGLGIYLNANSKKKEIRANILSKNELEVLANFRQDCSDLSTLIWKYNNEMDKIIDLFKTLDFSVENNMAIDRALKIKKQSDVLNDIYFDIKQKNNLVYLDITNHSELPYFKEDLESLMSTLENSLNDLQEENYKHGESNENYDLIVAANNQFIKSAGEYAKEVFKQQANRIS